MVRCIACGLVYVNPQHIPPDTAYQEDYYEPWLAGQDKARRKLWARRLADVEKLWPQRGALLDIGCGIPLFLDMARSNGWQVQGTEISGAACRHAEEKLGIPVFHGPVENAPFEKKSFDVITMWHVLEHIDEPFRTLSHVHGLLRPGGLLVVATPNLNNYFMRAAYRIGRGKPLRLFSTNDREIHLFHFTAATHRRALLQAGFDVLRTIPDNGEVERIKILTDLPARALHKVTGLMLTNTIRTIARRPMEANL